MAGNVTVIANQCCIILVAQLLGVGRFVSNLSQTRNATPFLIDGNDWFDHAEIAQVVGEFSQLCRRFDVADEQDESS